MEHIQALENHFRNKDFSNIGLCGISPSKRLCALWGGELMTERLFSTSLVSTSLRRSLPDGFRRPERFEGHPFDDKTLWYDAFWKKGRVYLICPKLWGLKETVLKSQFYIDDTPVRRPRIRSYPRYHILSFKARKQPRSVGVDLDGHRISSAIHPPEPIFDGLNVGVTLSQNNDLIWIEDFARYHNQVHAMQGMVFFDHLSDRYAAQEVEAALIRGGLGAVRVISVPFPYGFVSQNADGKDNANSEMLQTSLLNIARLRFFGKARAVLVSDIDELVWCDSGSVFDAARARWTGFLPLGVAWRYPPAEASVLIRHEAHQYYVPDDKPCFSKYCISPKGLLGGLSWGVHTLEKVRLDYRIIPETEGIWHCAGITTGWKDKQRHVTQKQLRHDAHAQDVMARTFSTG